MEPQTPPPAVEDELNRVVAQFTSTRRLPLCIPQPLDSIARWWMNLQEPPRETERPYRSGIHGSDGSRWVCPYHNRLVYTLRKFLFLSKEEQQLILVAREDGIFWRGDDMLFFKMFITETERMRIVGVTAYRSEAMAKTKRLVRHLDQDLEAIAEREAIQQNGA